MTSFDEARQIVIKELGDSSLFVPEWGYENDQWWSVMAGDKRFLAGLDDAYMSFDDRLLVVNKETGEFQERSVVKDFDFFESFKPYGDVPQMFQ